MTTSIPTEEPKAKSLEEEKVTPALITGKVAIIFDSQEKSKKKGGFIGKAAQIDSPFSDRVKFGAPVTPGKDDQPAFVDNELSLDLLNGINLGVSKSILENHRKGKRFRHYESNGAFEIFEPMKGKEGIVYADYKTDDAVLLVQATLSIELLKQYGKGEERAAVLEEIVEQEQAIKQELEARMARNRGL